MLIGIDCATLPTKTGLARAEARGRRCRVTDAMLARTKDGLADTVAGWVSDADHVLIAIDAPLGWPTPLADELALHRAGEPLRGDPDRLFRRATDRHVEDALGKRPLDVGADRIARTAKAALDLLSAVRRRTELDIPLAWDPEDEPGAYALEVYPAGTLRASGLPDSGYKKAAQRNERDVLVDALARRVTLGEHDPVVRRAPDVLDAVLCVAAAHDFLQGRAVPPQPDDEAIHREGWIWVRRPARKRRES